MCVYINEGHVYVNVYFTQCVHMGTCESQFNEVKVIIINDNLLLIIFKSSFTQKHEMTELCGVEIWPLKAQ